MACRPGLDDVALPAAEHVREDHPGSHGHVAERRKRAQPSADRVDVAGEHNAALRVTGGALPIRQPAWRAESGSASSRCATRRREALERWCSWPGC
jgi:hypothetical protein